VSWIELLSIVLPPTIAALAAYWKARSTHRAVNSRMDELLRLAREESAATATLKEKTAEMVRQGEAAVIAKATRVVRVTDAPG